MMLTVGQAIWEQELPPANLKLSPLMGTKFSRKGDTAVKHLRLTVLILCGIVLSCRFAHAQTMLLPERWLFTTGDKAAYTDVSFDDRNWKTLWVPSPWEHQGYPNYDGFAWYRVHFEVDDALVGQTPYLVLGKIDDADQTYLNGVCIGATGGFPPHAQTAFADLRVYHIPPGVLKKNNVLAVRVFDMGGLGGITEGPIGLYDEQSYQREFHPPPGPRASWHTLVTSNGLIAATYDAQRDRVRAVLPHIFQSYDDGRYVNPVIAHIAPSHGKPPLKVEYEESTHVILVTYGDGVKVRYFAPFSTEEKILYAVVSGPVPLVANWKYSWEGGAGTPLVESVSIFRDAGRMDKIFLFGFTDAYHRDADAVKRAAARLRAVRANPVDAELLFMHNVLARCKIPAGLRPQERAALAQSIAVLKMAQVGQKEIFPHARGQIIASLPPGVYNIAWVRDGAYATLALNRLGLFEEARHMLEFEIGARSGNYEHFVSKKDGKDYGIGMPYLISVCRYFGCGKEESDGGDDPNIETDDFGLFLVAFCDYVNRSGDTDFYRRNVGKVARGVADVILFRTDGNGLMRADSGPWEWHLKFEQHAYTSLVCAAGLRDFAELESHMGTTGVERYRTGYETLRSGIRRMLIAHNGWIKSNPLAFRSDAYDTYDGGTFEAFALGVFPDAELLHTHLVEYDKTMRVSGGERGYLRVNKGDWYETGEWILMDLRLASGMTQLSDTDRARRLVDLVTAQSALNYNLFPEMYDPTSWGYAGTTPMVGFGAGAYVMALFDLYAMR